VERVRDEAERHVEQTEDEGNSALHVDAKETSRGFFAKWIVRQPFWIRGSTNLFDFFLSKM
jgi:hypothetical protein